jgi:hypothetical protein
MSQREKKIPLPLRGGGSLLFPKEKGQGGISVYDSFKNAISQPDIEKLSIG